MIKNKISKLLLLSAITSTSALAHGLWLNAFEAKSHGGSIVTVGLGTGHNLTIEDSISNRVSLTSFDLTTPSGEVIALKKPLRDLEDVYKSDSLRIVDSNLAMQKISIGKSAEEGTYSVGFETKETTFTKYLNTKGKEKFSIKPKEKIRDLKEIISLIKSATYGKTYFVNKQWTKPEAVGHELELIPLTDISKLYIGDKIELKVLYKGKELKSGFVTAKNALGKNDNALYAPIRKGKVKFTLTNFGQWKFDIKHTLKGEVDTVLKASATINIK